MSSSYINSKLSAVESNKKKGVLRTKNLNYCMLFIQNVHFVKGNENKSTMYLILFKSLSEPNWLLMTIGYYYNNSCP